LISSSDLYNVFYLYYWVWQRKEKRLPDAAAELKISKTKAGRLLVDFATERSFDRNLDSIYLSWARYQELGSKAREIEVLLMVVV
jgi:hypothetical protein